MTAQEAFERLDDQLRSGGLPSNMDAFAITVDGDALRALLRAWPSRTPNPLTPPSQVG